MPGTASAAGTASTAALAAFALGPGQGASIQFGPGEHILFRATAETTGGQLSLFEITAQPVDGPPVHLHQNHDETYYVLEGTFDVKVGEARLTVAAGGMVFIPRGTPHTFQNVGPRRSRLLVLATPGGAERYFHTLRSHMWASTDAQGAPELRALQLRHDVDVVGPSLGRPARSGGTPAPTQAHLSGREK